MLGAGGSLDEAAARRSGAIAASGLRDDGLDSATFDLVDPARSG
jgi:hypothetical protein